MKLDFQIDNCNNKILIGKTEVLVIRPSFLVCNFYFFTRTRPLKKVHPNDSFLSWHQILAEHINWKDIGIATIFKKTKTAEADWHRRKTVWQKKTKQLVLRSCISRSQKLGDFSDLVVGAFVIAIADHHFFLDRVQVLNREKKTFPSISYYFHIPKIFLIFFPHTGKNRNRRKSNLLP